MRRTQAVYFHAKVVGKGVRTDGPHEGTVGWPLDPEPGGEREGMFCTWRWDGERLIVRNDRYGFYPMFYFRREGEICLSTSIFRLIERGAPVDLDYRALSVFMRLESFLGEDTPFLHIRALPPGCLLEWSGDRFTLSGERVRTAASSLSLDDAVEAYRTLFTRAMERRLPTSDRFTVPLSGGKDSRHMLMELCDRGRRPPFCVTSRYFSPLETLDVEIATRVAASLGLKHYVIDPGMTELRAELWKNAVGDLLSLESGWMVGLKRFLEGRVDTIYDGIAGDLLSSDCFCTQERDALFKARRFEELADEILGRVAVEKFVDPRLHGGVPREEAVAYLAGQLREYADDPDPVNSFYFWNRTRRMVALAPCAVLGDIPLVHSPYLDHRLYDFLSSITSDFKLRNSLHAETIWRSYPTHRYLPVTPRHYDYRPHPGTERRLVVDFILFLLNHRPAAFRYRYIVPRVVRSFLVAEKAVSNRWLVRLTVYLSQLDELLTKSEAASAQRRIECGEQ